MISKYIYSVLFALSVLQLSQALKYCNCDIENTDGDPDIVFTEFKQCAYKEYESIRIEVESTECESSSSRYEEKQEVLRELEMARYELEEFLSELNRSILKRMKEAFLKFGCTTCSEYKSLVADILSESESEVEQRITKFRNGFAKCKSFVTSVVGKIANKFQSKITGLFGGKGTSSSKKFCDYEIDYNGDDPEIILNEIKKSSYKDYSNVKRELESMDCEESSTKYEEKMAMLKELETSRYELEENLSDLSVSVLEKMKEAYLKYGGAVSPKFKTLIVDVLGETEAQVRPYLQDLRNTFSRCRSFVGGTEVGGEQQTETKRIEKRSSVTQTRKICDYDIEYPGEDPSAIMTEIRQSTYREYENIRTEVESTECDSSSSQYEEKQELLKELEMARFELEKYLSDKNKSIMKRMKEAYLKFGSTTCSEYKKLVAEIISETETEVGPRIMEFRNSFDKCKSFVGSIVGSLANKFKSKLSGIFGGKSSEASKSRNFCDSEIDYVGNDPEIILNEIKKSTYKEYNSVKKELESMNCDQSSPKYEKKMAMLEELEMSRYKLEENLSDLGESVLEKMKEGYLNHGGSVSPKFKSLIVDVLSETEAQVRPYLEEIRDKFSKCKSFVGGTDDVDEEKQSETERIEKRSSVSQTRKICNYDIEYSDEDPSIIMTEIQQSTYREYENIRTEVESTECDSSSSKYEEKQELLKELEMARFELEKYLSDKNKSIMKRMKEAYLKFGSTTCSEYKKLVAEIISETETEVGPRIIEFRNSFDKCKSFVGSIVGSLANKFKSKLGGIFGGKGSQTSKPRNFCDSEIDYVGNDPEIILNEIKKSTYKEYIIVKKELESMNCDQSSPKYEEKMAMLEELEMSRYKLEENLSDLGVSILEKMKEAYLNHGGSVSPKLRSLIVDVLSETEAQVRPYLEEIRDKFSKCKTFVGGDDDGGREKRSTIKTREICSYDIEYSDDEDPDIVMTEIRQCAYREYESVKHELESMECESSSQQYEEKQELLKELEMARFELDKYLCDLNKSTLKRMKEAYIKFGSTTCSEYKKFILEILSETETEVGPRIMEFRNGFKKSKSFVRSIVGSLADKFKSKLRGIFGGESSSSSSRKFCDYKIEYLGNDPEIILNEIKKSTYKEYMNVKRELESMNCEQSSSKYKEKMSMLKNLEMSRYRLDEFLCDLSVSVLERMKGAYLEHGGMFSPKFKSLIVEVLSETEEQVRPYLREFRDEYSRCRSFAGGSNNVVSRTKSSVRGMISGSFSRMRS